MSIPYDPAIPFLGIYYEKFCISIIGNLNKEVTPALQFFYLHFSESVKDLHMVGSPFHQC